MENPLHNPETDQIKEVAIVRNPGLTQDRQAMGYNRADALHKMQSAKFDDFRYDLNPHLSKRVHDVPFQASTTYTYGTNTNVFIWDNLTQLKDFPVSGFPGQVSPQYTQYNVHPEWLNKKADSIRSHQIAQPKAYNVDISTTKRSNIVMQVPKSEIEKYATQSIWSKIKYWLVGNGSSGQRVAV